MKHFLFLVAAAGFLPGMIMVKTTKITQDSVLTELLSVQEEIVDLHNALRRAVNPPASNMLKMVKIMWWYLTLSLQSWDEEAAENARELSKFCDTSQSNALKRRITNSFCGENKYLTSHTITWSNVIQIWHNESTYFQYGIWSPTDEEKSVYHYTQIVWASSYLIGCGVSSCCKRLSPQYLYVCHYCHEGNEPDLMNKPYAKGATCDQCPNDCENKLCTNPCIYYDEYTNCNTQKVFPGCKTLSVTLQCKATCSCTTEIKW